MTPALGYVDRPAAVLTRPPSDHGLTPRQQRALDDALAHLARWCTQLVAELAADGVTPAGIVIALQVVLDRYLIPIYTPRLLWQLLALELPEGHA